MPRLNCQRARRELLSLERAFSSFREQVANLSEKGDEFSMKSAENLKGIIERNRDYIDLNLPIGEQRWKAAEILGKNLLGPGQFANAFGSTRSSEMPIIPFSKAELIEAKEHGEMLVLRRSKLPNGQPLNFSNLLKALKPEKKSRFHSLIERLDLSSRHAREIVGYDAEDTPHDGWALSSMLGLQNSEGKNYKQQSAVILETLEELKTKFGENELTDRLIPIGKQKIKKLDEVLPDPPGVLAPAQTYSKRLHDALVPLAHFRPSLVEYIYDLAMVDDSQYSTLSRNFDNIVVRDQSFGNFVRVKLNPDFGVDIANFSPDDYATNIRTGFQRYF